MARACGSAVPAGGAISGRGINLFKRLRKHFRATRIRPVRCGSLADRPVAPPAVFTHLRSPRGSLPQLAGEGGAKRRMGCGPLLRPKSDCTTVTANLRSKRPAFHTPSVAFGDTFPASRRRGRPAAARRLDDLCERRSGAPAGRSTATRPCSLTARGSAGAEHPPLLRFPGRRRRDPRGLTARECCQCVQRRAAQFSLRSVASSLVAATATRDRSADIFAIIARVSIFVEKLFSICSSRRSI